MVEAADLASGADGDSPWTKRSAATLAECMRRKLGIALVNVDAIDEYMCDPTALRPHDAWEALASIRSSLATLTALAAELEGKKS
jgi:hypothetical protein